MWILTKNWLNNDKKLREKKSISFVRIKNRKNVDKKYNIDSNSKNIKKGDNKQS